MSRDSACECWETPTKAQGRPGGTELHKHQVQRLGSRRVRTTLSSPHNWLCLTVQEEETKRGCKKAETLLKANFSSEMCWETYAVVFHTSSATQGHWGLFANFQCWKLHPLLWNNLWSFDVFYHPHIWKFCHYNLTSHLSFNPFLCKLPTLVRLLGEEFTKQDLSSSALLPCWVFSLSQVNLGTPWSMEDHVFNCMATSLYTRVYF